VSATSHFTREIRAGMRASRRAGAGVPVVPLLVLIALMAAAVAYIVYVLWPRWPEPNAALDAPELPITIAGVAFEVPPAAIRMPVQRRGGAQDRIDLAFLWPSLNPAADPAKPNAPEAAPSKMLDRVFVTIAIAGDTLSPADRVKSIYPRYASMQPVAGPPGLAVLAFRDGSPYQGEDLIYDAATPLNFLVRCTRAGATPGICLYERRIDTADVVVRFPRDWLDDWQPIAGNIDRLLSGLRPRSAPVPARAGIR
jgi:hypothetical protein